MKHYEIICEILETFDFEKVEKVMKCLKWHWWDTNGGKPPTIVKMKQVCYQILHDCYEKGKKEKRPFFIKTGGFCARFSLKPNSEDFSLELEFIVSSKRLSSEDII